MQSQLLLIMLLSKFKSLEKLFTKEQKKLLKPFMRKFTLLMRQLPMRKLLKLRKRKLKRSKKRQLKKFLKQWMQEKFKQQQKKRKSQNNIQL
jgi:hypothetical protein